MLLAPQSCLDQTAGNLTVVTAVRSTLTATPTLDLILKVPRYSTSGVPVPELSPATISMVKGATIGPYRLYSVSTTISQYQYLTTSYNVSVGTAADMFKQTSDLGNICLPFGTSNQSSTSSIVSRTSSTSSSSSSSSWTSKRSNLSSTFSTTLSIRSSTSSSASATPTGPTILQSIGAYTDYTYYGCQTEATSARALTSGSFYNYTGMTLKQCLTDCIGYKYWGVEYGGECKPPFLSLFFHHFTYSTSYTRLLR